MAVLFRKTASRECGTLDRGTPKSLSTALVFSKHHHTSVEMIVQNGPT